MLDLNRAVDGQFGAEAAEAVLERADLQVVPGREVLELHPGNPAGGEAALGRAGIHDLVGEGFKLFPGLGRGVRVEAGFFEHVLVVVKDRGRGVERHRQHVAFGVGVVADDGRQIGARVESGAGIGHQLVDRVDGALGGHHRAGADFEDLHDGGLLAGAEGGDGAGHRLGIGALVDRNDFIGVLAGVVAGDDFLELGAQFAAHGVPPCDLGGGKSRGGGDGQHQASRENPFDHDDFPCRVVGEAGDLSARHFTNLSVSLRFDDRGKPTHAPIRFLETKEKGPDAMPGRHTACVMDDRGESKI